MVQKRTIFRIFRTKVLSRILVSKHVRKKKSFFLTIFLSENPQLFSENPQLFFGHFFPIRIFFKSQKRVARIGAPECTVWAELGPLLGICVDAAHRSVFGSQMPRLRSRSEIMNQCLDFHLTCPRPQSDGQVHLSAPIRFWVSDASSAIQI